MFMKQDSALVATLLGPCVVTTMINGQKITVKEITDYPYSDGIQFQILPEKPAHFILKIRKPGWAGSVDVSEPFRELDGFLIIDRLFKENDEVRISFKADIRVREDLKGEKYFSYGPLVFAKEIECRETVGRIYAPGYEDLLYLPVKLDKYRFLKNNGVRIVKQEPYPEFETVFKNENTGKSEKARLIPVGKTILRQVTF
jgi:uncharacterized protein